MYTFSSQDIIIIRLSVVWSWWKSRREKRSRKLTIDNSLFFFFTINNDKPEKSSSLFLKSILQSSESRLITFCFVDV
jgi:hypothetical protein